MTSIPDSLARRPWFTFAGTLVLAAAALPSNLFVEQAFGRAPHSLAWGPALFRALLALHGLLLLSTNFLPRKRPAAPLSLSISRVSLAVLAGLTALAVLLRIPNLNSCMWLDEVLTMVRFARPSVSQILTSFPDQNQHMLYSLLAHASIRIFGEQAWALRLPSVGFGIASIWALFLVGRRLIGEKEALFACALMTVSYHHIWFSQNARGYMGLLFFTTLATWLWLEAMDRNSWGPWMGYSVSIALGMWIHMTIVFVAATHALIFLLVWFRSGRDPARLGRAAAAYILCGTFTLQLFALSLPEFLRTGLAEVSPPSEWTNPLWVVKESLRSLQIGFAAMAVVLCGGLLVAAGWIDIARREASAAWEMILPGIAGGGSMLALGHNLWPRFFFFCMGFALLIAVHGAMELPRLVAKLRVILYPHGWIAANGLRPGLLHDDSSLRHHRAPLLRAAQTGFHRRQGICRTGIPPRRLCGGGRPRRTRLPDILRTFVARRANSGVKLAALRSNTGRTFVVYTLPIELRAKAHPGIWKTAWQQTLKPIASSGVRWGEARFMSAATGKARDRPPWGCTKDAAPGLGINANGTLLDTNLSFVRPVAPQSRVGSIESAPGCGRQRKAPAG